MHIRVQLRIQIDVQIDKKIRIQPGSKSDTVKDMHIQLRNQSSERFKYKYILPKSSHGGSGNPFIGMHGL